MYQSTDSTRLEGRSTEEKLVQARIWMYWSIKLEYLSAIEIQKAQVYKIDIPRFQKAQGSKADNRTKILIR